MFSYECTVCDCRYPAVISPAKCPMCEGILVYSSLPAHTNWRDRVRRAQDLYAEEYEYPVVEATLRVEGKQLLLSSWDVIDSGRLSRLAPETIVQIIDGENTFHVEILGYSYASRVYVVRLFSVVFPDVIPRKWVKNKK